MNRKNYLICIDSDGCAIDSMTIKHTACFGPAFIEIWNLNAQNETILKRWNEINLYSLTRGINRFKGLSIILKETAVSDSQEALQSFFQWTELASELSEQALSMHPEFAVNTVFQKAFAWSRLVNRKISELPIPRSFSYVEETIAAAAQYADIAVVSAANKEAVIHEWNCNKLSDYVKFFFAQNDGSKAQCIKKLLEFDYPKEHILMIGDAIGDYHAAKENEIWFYPILTESEELSWKTLKDTFLYKFIQDQFQMDLQHKLIEKMKNNFSYTL